jgi:hypothetical protein
LVATLTNKTAVLTLQNTISGHSYQISSKTNLLSASWNQETNLVANQSSMQVGIALGTRTNVFFRVSEARQYSIASSFQGISGDDSMGLSIPDTMGVVGPGHFVELLNGNVAAFAKSSGQLLQIASVLDFFRIGTNPPPQHLTDTRILYDRDAQRWVASIIDTDSQNVILAVSKTNTPLDLILNWVKYSIPVSIAHLDSDYDTMGMDTNGIYISVVHRSFGIGATNAGFTVVAIRKPDIYNGVTNYTVLTNTNPGLTSWCIQPAVNFDGVASNGYAWFVAKGRPTFGANYQGGSVYYRRLQWTGSTGSTAVWVEPNWIPAFAAANYQNYYDFDGTNFFYELLTGGGVGAPQAGGSNPIHLGWVGSRLLMAVIRNGSLWTCQNVGLSGTNGIYSGDETGLAVDRSAVQWLHFQIDPVYGAMSYWSNGRIYDRSSSNPFWYYYPSVMVNCAGDAVIGFSGSSPANYIGAYYSWILSGDRKRKLRLFGPVGRLFLYFS